MNKVQTVIRELHILDEKVNRDVWINNIHPVAKLLVTFCYLLILMSFDKKEITTLLSMSLYLIIITITADISVINIIKRLWFLFLTITLFACINPVFDRSVYTYLGSIAITTGMISAITLAIKGYFALVAVSILSETTSLNDICYALNCLFVPKIITTMIYLINRYMMMLLQETNRVMNAYSLRAPKDKGIKKKAWGAFLGNMILRSIDRAERVYESMLLRGFDGSFYYKNKSENNSKNKIASLFFTVMCVVCFIIFRFIPVFKIAGELICRL